MLPRTLASCYRAAPGRSFGFGYTPLVATPRSGANRNGKTASVTWQFGIHRLRRGEPWRETTRDETLWVLLRGRARVTFDGRTTEVARGSLFDEGPAALHCGPRETYAIASLHGATEWAVVRTPNPHLRGARLYRNDESIVEDRGAGLAQGACRRFVRTIFDYSTRPEANLVAGEVVNLAGRWSSYPPHHHPQPEIYHYRFTRPHGYGHAELGDAVFKVRHGDTIRIPGGLDHAQVSAPGYAMYYLWVVRHLPGRPYKGFTFTPVHRWLLDPRDQGWSPTPLASSS